MIEAVLEEVSESVMSSTEVDELRDVLEDTLLNSGKFSNQRISEWLDGFDDCEVDEHRYGLIFWAHTFIESGEQQDARSVDILETKLLSTEEKAELALKIQNMDFVELGIFLDYIEDLLQEAKKLEKDKIFLQRNRDLSVEQRKILIKDFELRTISNRKKMVRKLPVIIAELRRQNESVCAVAKIRGLIDEQKISEARGLLNSRVVIGAQYRELEERISMIEMNEARDFLLAV